MTIKAEGPDFPPYRITKDGVQQAVPQRDEGTKNVPVGQGGKTEKNPNEITYAKNEPTDPPKESKMSKMDKAVLVGGGAALLGALHVLCLPAAALVDVALIAAACSKNVIKTEPSEATAIAGAIINFDPNNVQPQDTDTIYKPKEMYDLEHWALDIDTVDGKFTDKVDEKFWIQKYQYVNEYDKNKSKTDTTAYNGKVFEFAGSANQIADYDSKRYFGVYNDQGVMKDITIEKRTYRNGDDNLSKPSTVYIVPKGTQKGAGADYYYYDGNNNLLEHRWRLPQGDGMIYEFWGNPNNPSQQDVTVERHTVNWSEVEPLDDGKK